MENEYLRLGLDPAANTIAVTRADTNAAVTCSGPLPEWKPKATVAFTPASGDMFNTGEVLMVWLDGMELILKLTKMKSAA